MGLQSYPFNTVLWHYIGETKVSLPGFFNFFKVLTANKGTIMKKLITFLLISISIINAKSINADACKNLKGKHIFSGGECIEYAVFEGEESDKLVVLIHGAWKEGADTLAVYKPYAEAINLESDITTVAVALPGYSGSSTNTLTALTHEKGGALKLATSKKYLDFLSSLLSDLKNKFKAKELIVSAHSASAAASAALLGYKPNLINKAQLAGGFYKLKYKDSITANKVINQISKDTKINIIYGTKDSISKAINSKEFYKLAKSKGLKVKLIELNQNHTNLDRSEKAQKELIELAK